MLRNEVNGKSHLSGLQSDDNVTSFANIMTEALQSAFCTDAKLLIASLSHLLPAFWRCSVLFPAADDFFSS